jgi:hypothetical protein
VPTEARLNVRSDGTRRAAPVHDAGERRTRRLAAATRRCGSGKSVDANRVAYVLEALFAEIGRRHPRLVANLVEDMVGHADSAGLSQRVDPRRDVYSVADYIVVGEHYVPDVNPHPQPKLRIIHQSCLELARTIDRVGSAVEAGEGAISDLAKHPAVEFGKERAEQFAMLRQGTDRLRLVATHDQGIARDVAEHDRGELARRI